ncbi:hypothetical protein Ddye_029421, partial [Dipteronia dyeriana]
HKNSRRHLPFLTSQLDSLLLQFSRRRCRRPTEISFSLTSHYLQRVTRGCVKLSQYCFQELFCERMIDKDMGIGVDVVEKSENNNQNGVAWCCIGQAVVFGYGG